MFTFKKLCLEVLSKVKGYIQWLISPEVVAERLSMTVQAKRASQGFIGQVEHGGAY